MDTVCVDPFLASFEKREEHTHPVLQALQQESFQALYAMGSSLKDHPAFRFISLRQLYASPFGIAEKTALKKEEIQSFILPQSAHSHLVFVNGYFRPELSDLSALPHSIQAMSLEQALLSHHSLFLTTRLKNVFKTEQDPFAQLNVALNQDAAFLYIPAKTTLCSPIQVLHISTGAFPQAFAPRLHLVVGKESVLKIVATNHALQTESSHLHVPMLDILCEPQSSCTFYNLSHGAHFLESLRATIKQDASFKAVLFTRGSKTCRSSYVFSLKGERASADISGLSLLDKSHVSHIHGAVFHEAPHTRSMQLFKGVLEGISRFSYSGKIEVAPQAQKTEAYQLNKTLLLSPHAIVISEPNLEIGADDVKASHGSTIAQLSDQELFYLKARGIDEIQGKELLLQGFCNEILAQLEPFRVYG